MFEFMDMNMKLFHGFSMSIFWIIIIYIIFSMTKKEKSSALDILKKRLAKGEITQKEFESLKDTLTEEKN